MSSVPQNTDGQVPSSHAQYITFNGYNAASTRSTVAGRRRAPTKLHVNTEATHHSIREEELQYTFLRDQTRAKLNTNKPLPPLPGQKQTSRPASPMDRAAHWMNKKVVTPVKEFFKNPEVEEMIGHKQEERTHSPSALFAELRVQSDTNRHSRGRPSIDREASPAQRSGSVSSRQTSQSSAASPRSRDSNNSMTGGVRNALSTAHHVGSRLGLKSESSRLIFSDQAPAGMMDPCSVCHKEPKGVLYHGRCRDCR